jgi:hypothetical protein
MAIASIPFNAVPITSMAFVVHIVLPAIRATREDRTTTLHTVIKSMHKINVFLTYTRRPAGTAGNGVAAGYTFQTRLCTGMFR